MREFHGWSSQALFRVDPHALPYLHYGGIFVRFLGAARLPGEDLHEESLLRLVQTPVDH